MADKEILETGTHGCCGGEGSHESWCTTRKSDYAAPTTGAPAARL